MKKVFIDGKEGTTGLRINERLQNRTDIALLSIPQEMKKDPQMRKKLINQADIVFLCLPDKAAVEAVDMVENEKTRVIDASTAHRTLPGWAYGFPELSLAHRRAVEYGTRVAVPGCHASGFNALVYPLVKAGLMPGDYPIVCHSVTGYSGGGKQMIAQYEDPDRTSEFASPRQYGLGQMHKHLKEMKKISMLSHDPIFTPIVADYYSGMVVTVPIYTKLLNHKCTIKEIWELLAKHYEKQVLVKVAPLDVSTSAIAGNAWSGRDDMEIMVVGNDERIILAACFDNLGKGASGAAVQCMNIWLGVDETTNLVTGEK